MSELSEQVMERLRMAEDAQKIIMRLEGEIESLKADRERVRASMKAFVDKYRGRFGFFTDQFLDEAEAIVSPPADASPGTGQESGPLHNNQCGPDKATATLSDNTVRDLLLDGIEKGKALERERDEARAEVARLRKAIEETINIMNSQHDPRTSADGCIICDAFRKLREAIG